MANGANGVDVADDGSLWIVSAFDNQVRKYDERGNLLLTIGGFGTAAGQFNLPSALTIGPDNDVYVTDVGGNRVQRFTQAGVFVRAYGDSSSLSNPRGVAVDADGNVYVADVGTGLKKFGPTGALVQSYPSSVISQGFSVAIAGNGDLLVSDFATTPDVVKRIDPITGNVLQVISGFGQPTDIEVGPDGRFYVVDFNSRTVRTYAQDGTFVEATDPFATNIGAIAVDPYNRLVVSGGSQASIYNPEPVVVSQYVGDPGDGAGDAAFAAATSDQATAQIDFDGDGFDDLTAHTFRPIPENTYSSLGVALIGLDARSVGTQPWAHSQPIGAWQTGFSQPAQPYSFVFANPVASLGLFGNDVEADIAVTVHLVDGRREFFTWPSGGGASNTRFNGFDAGQNVITRIDFYSGDYHIIDDVRFGRTDTTPPTAAITTPAHGETYDLAESVLADFGCSDNVGVVACVGDVPAGASIDTSAPGSFAFGVTAVDSAGLTGTETATYDVSTTIAAGLGLDGSITANPGGHPVTVADAPDAEDGVVISVGGTGVDKVTLTVCGGFVVRLTPGSQVTLTCGSVIAQVAAGSVEVVTPSGNATMVVPSGGAGELEETGAAVNHGGQPITITLGGITQTLAPGDTADWYTEGFFAPVDMNGIWNTTKGGSNVPLQFRFFFGNIELTDPTAIDTAFTPTACGIGEENAVETLDAVGATTLSYDGDKFHLNWKTPKRPGTCFNVAVSTDGAPTIGAVFKLK